jgi:small subunit ribosomal protein S17
VVRVDRTVVHPKYGKRYVQSKKYHVHDEQNSHHVGDLVEFQASRPYSKTKRWRVLSKQS